MKRVAESQLTKDTADDEDGEEPATGIQKAEPSSLSGRVMRSLPKRAMASATPSATSTPPAIESSNGATRKSPEPASRFSGFTGFGSSTPSAFTFTSPISQASSNATQPSQITATPSGKLSQSVPTTQLPKGFSLAPASNPTPPNTPPSLSDAQAKRDAGHKYYLLVRGLNMSILDAITQAVEADPFVDITEMLEKYKSLRSSSLKEFNDTSALGSRQTGGAAPSSLKDISSMPTPPKSFFGFGKDTGTDTTSRSHAAAFTTKLDHPPKEQSSSPWSTKIGTSDKPGPFGASQPFTFGNEKSSSSGKHTSAQLATPFSSSAFQSLGKDDPGSTDSKITAIPDKSSQEQDVPQGNSTPSSPFSFKPSTSSVPLTPGLSSFLNPHKSSDIKDTKSNTTNPSPPSPSGFGFGTGKTSSVSNPFSFGKGSIGNPVGFAFGSPPATPSDVKPPGITDISPDSESKAASDADAGLLKSSQDPSPAPSQGSVYDADGPGEEDEVTLREVKAHAYKLAVNGDKKTWISIGRGQTKLKERVDGKRRILMRNSNNGQIILNFNVFQGFSMDINKNVITFCVPGEDDNPTVHRLRVPNESEAANWQKAIQRALDDLLPSHET